jgi:TPR repeat protein
MYANGQGVAQDYAEAVKWYRLAAKQKHTKSELNLGTMYAVGQGVAKDLVRAHMWLSLGAVSGDADAKKRDILAKQMTPQQIAEAQKLARDCPQRGYSRCD